MTGTNVSLTHIYMSRKMERFLNVVNPCFFVPLGSPRKVCDEVHVGVGTVPGGKQGFGVFAKTDFQMPFSSESGEQQEKYLERLEDFAETMPFIGYPLCRKRMKANGLTVEGVLAVTSSLENGGLRSQLADADYENVLFVSHGGSLATLVNAGGKYSKMEILPDFTTDALSNIKKPKMIDIKFDTNLMDFFKKKIQKL